MSRARDRRGWIRFCFTVLYPGIAVFGLVGWAASNTTGFGHLVLLVAAVACWLGLIALAFLGWRKHFKSS